MKTTKRGPGPAPPEIHPADNDPAHLNIFDCMPLTDQHTPFPGSYRLFGNANIGDFSRTNMTVAAQLVAESHGIFMRWYARHNVDLDRLEPHQLAVFHAAIQSCMATLVVGSKPMWTTPLPELLERRPRYDAERPNVRIVDPWPLWLTARQDFYVHLDWFGGSDNMRTMLEGAMGSGQLRLRPPPRVFVPCLSG